MSIDVGEDNEFFVPLDQAGNIEPGMLGCYPGSAADLNVTPVPGFNYKWEALNDTEIAKSERRGWEVDLTQPARKVVVRNHRYSNIGYDRATIRGDVILMRCPEEVYRQIQLEEEEASKASRQDPASAYTNNPAIMSLQEKFRHGLRGPLQFRYPQHQVEHLTKNPGA